MDSLRTLLVVLLAAIGCGDDDPRLTVWAAASLSDVLPRVAEAFREEGGAEVAFSFDGSSRLARQIEAGAPASVFVSADAAWMDYLEERGRIVGSTRIDVATNRLVVIVPAGAGRSVNAPEDLASPEVQRIALAAEAVPAGRYAEAALAHHGLGERLSGRFVRGANVRAALAYVSAGEADAGIVYRTDAIAEPRVREAFAFDVGGHPPIVYSAAMVRDAPQPALAQSFLRYLAGERARRIFREAGFE